MIDLFASLHLITQKPVLVASSNCTIATWYDTGHTTANGEPFRPDLLEAAHPWRPFGSYVTLRNPRNGRAVTVRINDRKPSAGFDLTPKAFKQLGHLDQGVIEVCVE